MSGDQSRGVVEAYALMRKGALYMVVVGIVVFAATVFFVGIALGSGAPSGDAVEAFAVLSGVLFIASTIVALIGLWRKFIPGVKMLARIDEEFSSASILINVGWFWGFILSLLMISVAIAFFAAPLDLLAMSSIMLLVAAVPTLFGLIGMIGFTLLNIQLYSREGNRLYLVVAYIALAMVICTAIGELPLAPEEIYYALAPLVPASWILMYIALGNSIEKQRGCHQPLQSLNPLHKSLPPHSRWQ